LPEGDRGLHLQIPVTVVLVVLALLSRTKIWQRNRAVRDTLADRTL
jgi:hypothetical protein